MKSCSTYWAASVSEATARSASGDVPIHAAYAAAVRTKAAPHASVSQVSRYSAAGSATTKNLARSAMALDRAPVKRVLAWASVAERDADSPLSGATERTSDRWPDVDWYSASSSSDSAPVSLPFPASSCSRAHLSALTAAKASMSTATA